MNRVNIADNEVAVVVPVANQRLVGWIVKGDRAVCIQFRAGQPIIITGRICSSSDSHSGVDNVTRAVMWSDVILNTDADSADDAYELCCQISDPFFLKASEVRMLQVRGERGFCDWFSENHRPCSLEMCQKIVESLSMSTRQQILRAVLVESSATV
jgi:hypothetical protein